MTDSTGAVLVSQLRAIVRDRDDFDPSIALNFLNSAQRRIARLRDWDELRESDTYQLPVELIKSTGYLTIQTPNTIRQLIAVSYYDSTDDRWTKLQRITSRQVWVEKYRPNVEIITTQDPQVYHYWKRGQVELFPVPDTALTFQVDLTRWPPALEDTAVPSKLLGCSDLILAVAAYDVCNFYEYYDKAKVFLNTAQSLLQGVVEEDATVNDNTLGIMGLDSVSGTSEPWADPFVRSIK